jgi:hypothetical protein
VRTVNAPPVGDGAADERPYWIENHFAAAPSVPYVGSAWDSLNVAMLAAGGSWAELAPDESSWRADWGSVEESLRDARGELIVSFASGDGTGFTPGEGTGYSLGAHPEWVTSCGVADAARPYVALDTDVGGVVSEIGHGARTDLLAAGIAMLRTADMVGDSEVYLAWQSRTASLLREMTQDPPDPAWARCKTAVHVSANRAYHTARIAAGYLVPLLSASGYEVGSW